MPPPYDDLPVTSQKGLLFVIPGLLATLGLVNGDFSIWSLLGGILLGLFMMVGWVISNKQLPDWSLMAGGILLGIAQPIILSTLGIFTALISGTTPSPTASPIVLALPWIGIALILFYLRHNGRSVSKVVLWAGIITICCLLVRVKYFVLYGISWSILWKMLGISLWAAGTLLLPTMIVGLLPRRFGAFTILFAIGATFSWYEVLIDNGFKVSISIGSQGALWVYLFVVRSLFIIIGPWLFLCLKDLRRKLMGLISSICASVVINIVISGVVRGDFTLVIWLSAIPYTICVGLSPVLAYRMYRSANDIRKETQT